MAKKKTSKQKSAFAAKYRKAEKVLKKHRVRLMRRKGVIGCGLGFRQREGKRTKELAIRIYVEEKLPLEDLKSNQIIQKKLEGIEIDVIERGEYKPLQDVGAGNSIKPGHQGGSGTMGLVVYTPSQRLPRFLTNAHVVIGAKDIDEISSDDTVVLKRHGTDPVIGNAMPSKLELTSLTDCALVKPTDNANPVPGVPGVTGPLVPGQLGFDDVDEETVVIKIGAKTKRTTGIVDSITESFSTDNQTFYSQIAISGINDDFSAKGDSGSVVLKGNEVVGILHGVTDDGVAIACDFLDAQDRLNFVLEPKDES